MPSLLTKCPICDSDRTRYRWTAVDTLDKPWRYDICHDCNAIFLNPMPESSELDKYYSQDYYGPDHRRFVKEVEYTVLLFRRARAMRVMRTVPRGSSVLDVGCGRGVFLEILAKRGYRCLGIERSEASGRDAKKRVDVKIGNFEELDLPGESFDLVTFWQVIEHLQHPKNAIVESQRILKPGGKMLIQAPNPESLQACAGPSWFHLDSPRHIFLFPLSCIDRMAAQSGFVREKVSTLNFEYSPFGMLQSLWNMMGVKRDMLYEMLMAAPNETSETSTPKNAALFAASAIAAPLAGLLSLVEWAVGKGGIIEATYIKKPIKR